MMTTFLNEVWRLVNVDNVQIERTHIFAIRGCGSTTVVIRTLAWRKLDTPSGGENLGAFSFECF